MNEIALNETNKKIISLLQRDGLMTNDAMARQLNLSTSTVFRSVARMIGNNIIRIVAVVDPAKVGFPVTAVVAFDVQPEKWQSVMTTLKNHPAINMTTRTTGRFDIISFGRFRSVDELDKFITEAHDRLDGVKDSEAFLCLHVHKGRWSPLNGEALDTPHQRLIELLQDDGRRSTVALAKAMKSSPSTIQRNIRELIESRTIRVIAIANPFKTGVPFAAIIGFKVLPGKWLDVASQLVSSPPVRFVARTIGRFDILSFARFASQEELAQFLEGLSAKIYGIVNTETMVCLDVQYGRMYAGLETPVKNRTKQL